MNARIVPTALSLGESFSHLWDAEAERIILGAAMLAHPMPAWLESRHFFPTQHQCIYEAVQSVGGHVARVNAWLRESSKQYGPQLAKSNELAEMCIEAKWHLQQGWALDFETLRELSNQRALVETMARLTIELRHGKVSHGEARVRLKEHFQEAKR